MSRLVKTIEDILRALPDNSSPEAVAAALADVGPVSPTRRSLEGDVAYFGGGGLGASRWGQAAPKGNAKEAARLTKSAPGCDLAVIGQNDVAIVDLKTRTVFKPKTVVDGKLHSSPARGKPALKTSERMAPTHRAAAPSIKDASAAVRLHQKKRSALDAAVRKALSELHELERRKAGAEQDLARTKAQAGAAAVEAVQSDMPMPDLTNERDAMIKAQLEIEACDAAMPAANEKLRGAKTSLEEHDGALVEVALDLDAALTAEALSALSRVLLRLEKPLAALAAVSLVRSDLIGTKFTFDRRRHQPPVGGAEIAAAVVSGMPSGLCDALAGTAIETRATEIASEILSTLKP